MRGARWLVDSLRAKLPFNKGLGQHFLVNDEVIASPVSKAKLTVDDHVLEIGPGPGVLTEVLLSTGCKVTAIEIDECAVKHLNEAFLPEVKDSKLILIEGDALNFKWPDGITKVIANIPYQISSPLIDLLTKYLRSKMGESLELVILLVQEKIAERLVMEYESDIGTLGMTAMLDWE